MMKIDITTITFGEHKALFVPLEKDGKNVALGFFVKKIGRFEDVVTTVDLEEHIDETIPVVAFMFKNKKSINELIKFLRFYRNEIYKKPTEVE